MSTRVMSLRIDPGLLEEIRRRARAEGRSVSSQILHLVRNQLGVGSPPKRRARRTMGWLAHLDVPEDLGTYRRFRRSVSHRIMKKLRGTSGST
ncbi:MAG: Arc family DNA-binding protein [Deltaproteobacteria bacterium]|nr:MAG: Arc family DNA-binding protein [Deltaproteobacteria bacterium]TMA70507.1 MAG: Arc family DNA-binding protein [Deltaproteobacteria bacterium]